MAKSSKRRTLLEQCAEHRARGRSDEALKLFDGSSEAERSCALRVEAALNAFLSRDPSALRRVVEGDARATKATEPLLAILESRAPVGRPRNEWVRGFGAMARALELITAGEHVKARTKLDGIPAGVRGEFRHEDHKDALSIRVTSSSRYRPVRILNFLLGRELSPAALRGLGRLAGAMPALGRYVLDRKYPDAVREGCREARAAAMRAAPGSQAALLEVDPGAIPESDRAALHLHRGYALAESDPHHARREFDRALALGADLIAVARGRWLASGCAPDSLERFRKLVARTGCPESELLVLAESAFVAEPGTRGRWLRRLTELRDTKGYTGAYTRAFFEGLLGLIDFEAGRVEGARTHAEKSIAHHPSAPMGWDVLLSVTEELEGPSAALEVLRAGRRQVEAAPPSEERNSTLTMLGLHEDDLELQVSEESAESLEVERQPPLPGFALPDAPDFDDLPFEQLKAIRDLAEKVQAGYEPRKEELEGFMEALDTLAGASDSGGGTPRHARGQAAGAASDRKARKRREKNNRRKGRKKK